MSTRTLSAVEAIGTFRSLRQVQAVHARAADSGRARSRGYLRWAWVAVVERTVRLDLASVRGQHGIDPDKGRLR
jgi:hypothetical protein